MPSMPSATLRPVSIMSSVVVAAAEAGGFINGSRESTRVREMVTSVSDWGFPVGGSWAVGNVYVVVSRVETLVRLPEKGERIARVASLAFSLQVGCVISGLGRNEMGDLRVGNRVGRGERYGCAGPVG
jgi:hypothetical protein